MALKDLYAKGINKTDVCIICGYTAATHGQDTARCGHINNKGTFIYLYDNEKIVFQRDDREYIYIQIETLLTTAGSVLKDKTIL